MIKGEEKASSEDFCITSVLKEHHLVELVKILDRD